MRLLKNKYLLLPALFLFILYSVDKLFLLPEVRKKFIQPGGMVYYLQRESMIPMVRERARVKPKGEKLAVVFGDSRSFALGNVPAHLWRLIKWPTAD